MVKHFLFLAFVVGWTLQVRSQGTPIVADSASIYHDMANAKHGEGDYNAAIGYMSKAIASFPISDYILYRGMLYLLVDKNKEAFDDFSRILELNPDDLSALCWRGNANMGLKQYYRAVDDYTKAIQVFDPAKDEYYMNSQSYELRGRAYVQLGFYSKALDDYNKAMGIDTTDPGLYEERAAVYDKLGMPDLAQKDRETAEKMIDEANK